MTEMHEKVLKAAKDTSGDPKLTNEMLALARENPEVLLGKTRQLNNCLHIASICGHEVFCTTVLEKGPAGLSVVSLLSDINRDFETPLLTAVKSGHDSLALRLLKAYHDHHLNEALFNQDKHGHNVLHHAIRNGYEDLAVDLIDKQPDLSGCENNSLGSPMFIAVLKGIKRVYMKLLDIEVSKYTGVNSNNALHAAVKYDNADFVRKLVQKRTELAKVLAREKNEKDETPMHLAAHYNRVEILEVMLECDQSLVYETSESIPLLFPAAERGHVEFARALLKHCPDAPSCNKTGTCLHKAVNRNKIKFVEFILEEDCRLRMLVNMQDEVGNTALHLAVKMCNPKMVRALLDHPDIDITTINLSSCAAIWRLNEHGSNNYAKTVNWNQIFWHILDKDFRAETDIYNLHEEIKDKVIEKSREDVNFLTNTYIANTSVVAILIATITFAAAFTLPGGYDTSAGNEGLPIMARKLAFQAFLIFDTLGMCSSLAVAFICVIARWMDFEFLLHYRTLTKKLMWIAYMTTTVAFATGLYTVLAPRVPWLATAICVLSVLLPILLALIGEWPILRMKIRYHKRPFNSNFLDMV